MISKGESSCLILRLVQPSSFMFRHQLLNSTSQLTSNIRLAIFADNVSSSFPDPETAFPSYSELWLQSRRNATIRGFNVKQVFVRRSRFSVYQVGCCNGQELRNEDLFPADDLFSAVRIAIDVIIRSSVYLERTR